ncbi:hypothetical protein [Streptomyces sp. NPDC002611]
MRSVFGWPGGHADFRHFTGAIVGRRLLAQAEVSLALNLDVADRDLGLSADRSRVFKVERCGGVRGLGG